MNIKLLVTAAYMLSLASATWTQYYGDGSAAADWPSVEQWRSFNELWSINQGSLQKSCSAFDLPNNTPEEIEHLKAAITQASDASGIDKRFILAFAMQESNGCVHVHSTVSADGTVRNPGIMQDHDGDHSCNLRRDKDGSRIETTKAIFPNLNWTPDNFLDSCPQEMITGMIMDGVLGTKVGDGLVGTLTKAIGGPVVNYPSKRQSSPTVSTPPTLSSCDAVAVAQYSNAVFQGAVQSVQLAYSGNTLIQAGTVSEIPIPSGLSSCDKAAVGSFATQVWDNAASYMQAAYSGSPVILGQPTHGTALATSALPTTLSTSIASAPTPPIASSSDAPTVLSTSVVPATSLSSTPTSSTPPPPSTPSPPSSSPSSPTSTNTSTATTPTQSPSPHDATSFSTSQSPPSSSLKSQFQSASAQSLYRAARIYNTGSLPDPNDLTNVSGGSPPCYVIDVANRLMGWDPLTGRDGMGGGECMI